METYILFFILAGLLIAILIGFSVWSARREKSRIFSNTFSTRPPSTPINNDIIGNVPPTLNPRGFNPQASAHSEFNTPDFAQTQQQEVQNSVKNIKISLPGQQAEPMHSEQAPIQPAAPTFAQQIQQSQPIVETPPTELYEEPRSQQPQVEIAPVVTEAEPQPEQQVTESENGIITLYVVAPEGQQFRGDFVVQQLETLGFQFGEYQIFHRHIDNTTSPVLFSVANMMQPGIFDLSKIEQFNTVGLVFFMHLPSVGNDLVNLRLMIRTVESFAQAVGGFVLDEQHQLFDDQSRQNYLLRVTQA
ncbi:cell division protein ZipA [Glaesserella sp.]|uniref:cell division protein ZipA n=1 Tax=Glaesserella sp. TaxID=2094731 RepID=UPI0035A059BD